MNEKIYCIHDEWDGVAVKGIADFNSKPHYFSVLFNEEEDDFLDSYELIPINHELFELEMENWDYFLYWLKAKGDTFDFKSKNPHPYHYAELREDKSFEAIKDNKIFSNMKFAKKAEKYYQNSLQIQKLKELEPRKLFAKASFLKNDKRNFLSVNWTQLDKSPAANTR